LSEEDRVLLPDSGRLLGLDAGERRVGVAISDPDQRLAVPLTTLDRGTGMAAWQELERLVRDEEVSGLVVGLPLSLTGEAGEQAERAREFAREAEKRLNLPVAFWDERLSSQEADRMLAPGRGSERGPGGRRRDRGPQRRPEKGATDQVAATIILQAFLDSRRGPRFEV
jgi:putative Holliday junction resolvase